MGTRGYIYFPYMCGGNTGGKKNIKTCKGHAQYKKYQKDFPTQVQF